jgi:hypothetical protein
MGIGAEIVQDVFGTAEGWLGVDDQSWPEQPAQPCVEGLWLGERQEVTEELEFPSMERVAKSSDELAAEYMAEYADGQKEGASRGESIWSDPVRGRRQRLRSGHADETASAVPAVEHAEETDLGSG